MPADALHDADLVLVAHGSTLNPGSARPTYQHADALRERGVFASVTEAFLQQEPSLAGALRRTFAPRVFIVPLFISEGWFTETVIPSLLGFARTPEGVLQRRRTDRGRFLHYCHPVGSHPSMTRVLRARAQEALDHGAVHPPPLSQTTLLIAGHGTGYSKGSRTSIERQVARLRESATFAEVHGIFLEESPAIADAWSIAPQPDIVLVPFFISDGLHTQEDIPEMLGESREAVRRRLDAGLPTWPNPTFRQGKRLWCARAVGTEPGIADVILERVAEAAATPA